MENAKAGLLSMEIHDGGNYKVLCCHGEIDYFTEPMLKNKLHSLIDSGSIKIVVDLTNINYLDSISIKTLLHGEMELKKRNGELALLIPDSSPAKRIFEALGVGEIMRIFKEIEQVKENGYLNSPA